MINNYRNQQYQHVDKTKEVLEKFKFIEKVSIYNDIASFSTRFSICFNMQDDIMADSVYCFIKSESAKDYMSNNNLIFDPKKESFSKIYNSLTVGYVDIFFDVDQLLEQFNKAIENDTKYFTDEERPLIQTQFKKLIGDIK